MQIYINKIKFYAVRGGERVRSSMGRTVFHVNYGHNTNVYLKNIFMAN